LEKFPGSNSYSLPSFFVIKFTGKLALADRIKMVVSHILRTGWELNLSMGKFTFKK
jgi:hypothetical protein